MSIDCLFRKGAVLHEIKSSNKYDAIREVINQAPVFKSISKLQEFENAVISREKIQTTGFGHGIAVAHGKTTEVDDLEIALGISQEGLEFDAMDGQPVHLLFLIANHPDHQVEYLKVLSTLISQVRKSSFRNMLITCKGASEAEHILGSVFKKKLCDFLSQHNSFRHQPSAAPAAV